MHKKVEVFNFIIPAFSLRDQTIAMFCFPDDLLTLESVPNAPASGASTYGHLGTQSPAGAKKGGRTTVRPPFYILSGIICGLSPTK